MSVPFYILYCIISLVVFIGIVFLQKLLTKKHILLGLILPLLILFNTIIIDVQIISTMYRSTLGPRVFEKYNNGLLISKSTVVTSINLPTSILILVFFNVLTVVLFVVFFAERKKIKREKELTKMRINDLE